MGDVLLVGPLPAKLPLLEAGEDFVDVPLDERDPEPGPEGFPAVELARWRVGLPEAIERRCHIARVYAFLFI
jgi:hypothetical protein